MEKLYVWKRGDRYYVCPGYSKDINKAEIHHKKSPIPLSGAEREVEVTLMEVIYA